MPADKFLEKHELTQEEIENPNSSMTNKEFEWIILNLPMKKNPEPDGFSGRFSQIFKENKNTYSS